VHAQRVIVRHRPRVPIALATTTIVLVALLGAGAGPATAGGHRYKGPAPGAVTCHLSGAITFSPRMSASDGATHSARLKGRLGACRTTDSAVTIKAAVMTETFATSPVSCATVASTDAPATVSVSWKGRLFGAGAAFDATTEHASGSHIVTDVRGDEGFALPGAGTSAAIGSFGSASGSGATMFTRLSPGALASACRTGVRRLTVTGTVTVGSLSGPTGGGPASAVPLGDYAGTDDPRALAQFGATTGTRPTYVTDYLDKSDGWAAMDNAAIARSWAGTGYRLVLGVPILPGTGTLSAGAAGEYNGYFATLARNLVNGGEADAILRLGWEFNGSWYPWYVATAGDAANFVRFWQQIVITMRSAPGQHFTYLWSASASTTTSYTPAAAYPGDAYVDYVGTDVYDDFWGSPFTPAAGWTNQLTQQWGLDWLASFATAQAKPITIPEWSVEYRPDGHGFGDDPSFIDHMAAWFVANHVVFTAIFSFDTSNTPEDDITDGAFPQSLREFQLVFG
jgi:hypothetical protein